MIINKTIKCLAQTVAKKIFFLAIFLFFCNYAFCIEISEEKAILLALANSKELKIAQQGIEEARGLRYEAISLSLPQIYLSGSYTRMNISETGAQTAYITGMFFPFIIPSIPTDQSTDLYGAQATAYQNIFTWGRNFWVNEQSKQNCNLAQEKLNQIHNDTIFKAKENFYKTLLASKLSIIASESYELSQKRLEMTKKLFNEGKASKYDVSRAEVVVANGKVQALKAENAFAVAKEALKSFLDIKDEVQLSGEFNEQNVDFDISEIWEKMLQARPEIKQMEYQEKIAKSNVSVMKTDNKPKITAGYVYTAQSVEINTSFDQWQKGWQLGVAFFWPLFDGLLSYGKIKKAQANLEQVIDLNRSKLEILKLEVISAYLNFQQAKKSIVVQKKNVKLAGENLKIAHRRYSLGLMSSVELQDVQFAFSQAETNHQQALYDYNIAIATLKKVMGNY